MTLAVALTFFAAAILGMPIAFALGLSALVGLGVGDMPFNLMGSKVAHSVNSFPFMAIPFFMLTGELLVVSGIMGRMIAFANTLVGHVRGGLAQATVLSGIGIASVSGAAVADAAALGSALSRPMGRIYGVPFTCAIIGASANLGPIIPPSTAMIIYATLAGASVSIAQLFAAGILPGLMIAVGTMIAVAVIARGRGYPATSGGFSLAAVWREGRRAFLIMLMPVIVIGGIVGGAFTATEGGAIAVAYALLLGFAVTRTLKLSHLPGCLLRAVITTSVVGALIAFASTVTYLFSIDMVPQRLGAWISGISADPYVFMLAVVALLLIVGMFIEPTSAYIMLVPVFAPMVDSVGVDPIHFAIVFIMTLVLGMLTPPVGTLLFVMCSVGGIPMAPLVREVVPFVAVYLAVILICLFLPDLVLLLPGLVAR